MNYDQADFEGGCHCGAVRFRVHLVDGLNTARRCSCTYCRMRGAVAVSALVNDLEIVAGAEWLTHYAFNTQTAKHYFCSRCGIYTHHQRRSNPSQLGVNVACLAGLSPFDFYEVPVLDGVNHPSDSRRGADDGVLGVLRFVLAGENEDEEKVSRGSVREV